jgi:hypothetical protein
MSKGGVLAIAIVLLAAASAFGVITWLKRLQTVAAEKAAEPCVVPDERACEKDVDCVEVSCPNSCICGEDCGEAISRDVLKREHHICLQARMEPRVPVGCRVQNRCKCEYRSCEKQPRCISGRCEMVAPSDAGAPPY